MKRWEAPRQHGMSGAFVFLLLGVFALFSTLLVLLSAQLYRTTVEETRLHQEQRVIGSYLMNIVRANDAQDAVHVRQMDGIDVLCFGLDTDEEAYITYVYCWDGALRELFAPAEKPFAPQHGESICPAQDLRVTRRGALLEMTCLDAGGREQRLYAALRCDAADAADEGEEQR